MAEAQHVGPCPHGVRDDVCWTCSGYWVVPKAWPGSTVVCIGGGPSLTPNDIKTVWAATQLSPRMRLRSEDDALPMVRVISINDSYRLAPWADLLYGCDWTWWDKHLGARAFQGGHRVIMEHPDKHEAGTFEAAHRYGLKVLRCTGESGFEDDPTAIRHGYNGGYQAVHLAVKLGAKRVLLLGYDMKPEPVGVAPGKDGTPQPVLKHHWHGDDKDRAAPPYRLFLKEWGSLVLPLRERGVQVINCTPGSALDSFPRQTLSEALC